MPRLQRCSAALLSLLAAGCTQSLDAPEPLPLAANFLQLESYVAVSADGLAAAGFLRWVYVADDPLETESPRPYCEVWERFDLDRVDAGVCAGCTDVWTGEARIDEEEAACDDADWPARPFSMGFGPVSEAGQEVVDVAAEGSSHAVWTRWAPDVGNLDGFEPLFLAAPGQWSSETAPVGTSGDRPVAGDYILSGLYSWDLR